MYQCSIKTTKKALLKEYTYHVMKFHAKRDIDLFAEDQFTRPIKLQRRDPRDQPGGGPGMAAATADGKEDVQAELEREQAERAKEQRRLVREENQKLIAPTAEKKKINNAHKKVEQVWRSDDTPADQRKNKLRYEEARQWHLEDFDGHNTWSGSYEQRLSWTHVMLRPIDKDFTMVPVNKWYKFIPKGKTKAADADQVDDALNKKVKQPKWMEETRRAEEEKRRLKYERSKQRNLFERSAGRGDDDDGTNVRIKTEEGDRGENAFDADDADYNMEEAFADDEEGINGLFEGDEDEKKEVEQRIKREQLGANIFGRTDETAVWRQEEEEEKLAELQKKKEKATRKALVKREKNTVYEADDSDADSVSYLRSPADGVYLLIHTTCKPNATLFASSRAFQTMLRYFECPANFTSPTTTQKQSGSRRKSGRRRKKGKQPRKRSSTRSHPQAHPQKAPIRHPVAPQNTAKTPPKSLSNDPGPPISQKPTATSPRARSPRKANTPAPPQEPAPTHHVLCPQTLPAIGNLLPSL